LDKGAKKSPPKDPKGHKWKKLPKGWTDESRKKFWDSLTSRAPKHKVTQCINRMEGKVSNPGAFCAALADRVIPGWREEAAKERRKKKKAKLAKLMSELEESTKVAAGSLRTRYDYNEAPPAPTEEDPHSMLPGKDADGPRPAEALKEIEERRAEEEDEDDRPHSQMPGTDNLTMEEDHKVASSKWITREQMEKLCPPCAEQMRKAGFNRVSVAVMRRKLARKRR